VEQYSAFHKQDLRACISLDKIKILCYKWVPCLGGYSIGVSRPSHSSKSSRLITHKLLLLLILLLTLPAVSLAKNPIRTFEGQVTKVSDGNTIQVNSNGTKLKIRLYGIDAPETEKSNKKTGRIIKPGQPYGDKAWKALEGKVARKGVKVEVMAIDQYRRLVSLVWLGNRSINREMVAEGYAWAYRQYLDTPYASEFIGLEETARASRLGLWHQNTPEPPWEFRRKLRKR
jgi:endonuclease YncB( thermonuclease family)